MLFFLFLISFHLFSLLFVDLEICFVDIVSLFVCVVGSWRMTSTSTSDVVFFGQDVGGSFHETVGSNSPPLSDKIFYSDAATSCIICFASGSLLLSPSSSSSSSSSSLDVASDPDHERGERIDFVIYGHLSTKKSLDAFFCHLTETVSGLVDEKEADSIPTQHCLITMHATGAVNSVNKRNGVNEGKEMKSSFEDLIREFNESNSRSDQLESSTNSGVSSSSSAESSSSSSLSPDSHQRVTFEICLVSADLLFRSPNDHKHSASFEWKTKRFDTNIINIDRCSFPEKFGNHVMFFAFSSKDCRVHFMDNRCLPPVFSRQQLVNGRNILFYFLRESSREELLRNSTTPECEPEEFFENHELARIRSLQLLSSLVTQKDPSLNP